MRKNPNPSIYPSLVAEFIEASEDGGTLDAIAFLTHEKLETLKNEYQRKIQEEAILKEAKRREAHIFEILPELVHDEWTLTLILNQKVKKILLPIQDDILFLYEQRMGVDARKKLMELLASKKDEPVYLIISYKKNPDTNSYFIKKLFLR